MEQLRPTWVEINMANLAYNFRQVKKRIGLKVKVLAAVKANAYGHGIVESSRVLEKCGVDYFGVANVDEATVLRKAKIKAQVLVLGAVASANEVKAALRMRVSLTVTDYSNARLISRYASISRPIKIHVKVDTGMGRLGLWHKQAEKEIVRIAKLPGIKLEGLYTHFPSADNDEAFTAQQVKDFDTLIINLNSKDIDIPIIHAANSSAVCQVRSSYLNMVRPGIMLYGMYSDKSLMSSIKLKPVLSFKTKIVYLKTVSSGRSISYGRTYITKKKTKIATIPVGYADGYTRGLSNKSKVLVKGCLVPIVGRVCMDQTMIDVGNIPGVKLGDTVVLIGAQADKQIRAEDLALICDTIAYEISCGIPVRIRRVFKNY